MPQPSLSPPIKRYCLKRYSLVLWLLLSQMLFGTLTTADAQSTQGNLKENSAKLEKLRRTIQTLQHSLTQDKKRGDLLDQALEQVEKKVAQIVKKTRKIQAQITANLQKLNRLRKQLGSVAAKKNYQQRALVKQVRAAFIMGRQEYLKLLLNQEDPAKYSRISVYYDYFNRERSKRIAQMSETIDQLTQVRQAYVSQKQRLAADRTEAHKQQQALKQQQVQRQQVLAKLNKNMQGKHQKVSDLEIDARNLENLLAQLKQSLKSIGPIDLPFFKPFSQMKGQLKWPVAGKLLQRHSNFQGRSQARLDGVLIQAQEGENVSSVYAGQVVFADWLRGFGLMIIINHREGYMSLYGHNQAIYTQPGEWVNTGELIAIAGNSGGQQQAGLYFGIRIDGQPSNPHIWCKSGKY